MIESDTVKLLRECDSGIKMGVSSIGDVYGSVQSKELKKLLSDCAKQHEELDRQVREALDRFKDGGKDPAAMVKAMSWFKTEFKLAVEDSDATIADLMTDGCDMGVKSLSRYLNQYAAASEDAKNIAKKLIRIEADLAVALRDYL